MFRTTTNAPNLYATWLVYVLPLGSCKNCPEFPFKFNFAILCACLYPQISDSLQRDEFAIKYKLAEKFEHVEQLMVDSESNHTIWWHSYTNEADEFRLRLWPTMTLHCILRYCCNMYLRLGCLSANFLLYCTTGKWTGLLLLEQSASQEGSIESICEASNILEMWHYVGSVVYVTDSVGVFGTYLHACLREKYI